MARRAFPHRFLFTVAGALGCALVCMYFSLCAFLPDRWFVYQSELLSADSSDAVIAIDSTDDALPPAFAELFSQTYSFDTLSAPAEALIIDTSYRAIARGYAMGGRKVSIAVCGVDSRLNERVEHADANHVITVWLDSGVVDIASIPRDTPCDAGYASGSRNNNLANLRARKGRDAYLKEVASIAGLDTVEYYVDLGFSQARGVLELLGFREQSGAALRVLRSRQIFASGDFQRSFNQGQFIRQMLLKQFHRLEGFSGAMLLRAGLYLVTTNLTADAVERIAGEMRTQGFPRDKQSVVVSLCPAYYARMSVFDFSDSLAMGSLLARINQKAQKLGIGNTSDTVMLHFRARLHGLVKQAAADTARVPLRAVANLRRAFEQRVWWQIADRQEREQIRASLGAVLAHAYEKTGRHEEAARVRAVVRFEQEMYVSDKAELLPAALVTDSLHTGAGDGGW